MNNLILNYICVYLRVLESSEGILSASNETLHMEMKNEDDVE